MNRLKQIWKNFEWAILNHPPTNITHANEERKCDYCDNTEAWTHYEETGMTICHECIKKIADKVLGESNGS